MQRIGSQFPVQDEFGNGIDSATVTVYDSVSLVALTTLYVATGSLTAPAATANPYVTDSIGRWEISLPDGRYNFVIAGGSITSYTIWNVCIFDNTITYPSPMLGTVTSASMAVPAELSVSGSPITGVGTFTVAWASLAGSAAQGKFIGTPSGGGAGTITSRVLALTDLPAFGGAANTYGTGALIPVIVVNAQGIATGYSTTTNTPAYASVTGKPTTVPGLAVTDGVQCTFRQTATVTYGNSTVETTLVGAGAGSAALIANQLVAGTTVRCKIAGYITNATAATTLQIKFKIGTNTVIDTTAIALAINGAVASSPFLLECVYTVRTTGAPGTGIGQVTLANAGAGIASTGNGHFWPQPGQTGTSSIDTTQATPALVVTAQWGTAAATTTLSVTNLQFFVEG